MISMQQAIVRLADSQRLPKREGIDYLSDSSNESNNESFASPDEDSDSLLENATKTHEMISINSLTISKLRIKSRKCKQITEEWLQRNQK